MRTHPEHAIAPDSIAVDQASLASLPTLDHAGLDWGRVAEAAYLISHDLRYVYPGPIEDLRHRLMVVPPARLGDQRVVMHGIEITGAEPTVTETADRFGNLVVDVRADRVEQEIGFSAWAVVQRCAGCEPDGLDAAGAERLGLLGQTRLTTVDEAIADAAAELVAAGPPATDHAGALALAERIAAWTSSRFAYTWGITSVFTTAAEALAGGTGVCQDYSHVMLAVCRRAGLAARYVSGHLLGEGGTHAWVDVLVPSPGDPGRLVAEGFDPTNDRRTGLGHVTVATGRDYADVAPTSGSFTADYSGRLETSKRVGVTAVGYRAA
jgi:transglutaminase-like putative cysteine protease